MINNRVTMGQDINMQIEEFKAENSQDSMIPVEIKHQNEVETDKFPQTNAYEYQLHLLTSVQNINKRLERAPKFKRGRIPYELYDVENAKDNYLKFLENEIIEERKQIYNFYHNKGYLGRTLICLVDKLNHGIQQTINGVQKLRDNAQIKT